MFAAFLATLLFALSVVFANRTTRMLGPTVANFVRLCVATLMLALWGHSVGQGLGGGGFRWFFLSGCIGFGLGDLALYQALPRIGPRLTGLLVQCLAAPFAALAEWLWMDTRLTPEQITAGLLILLGVGIAVAPAEHLHKPRNALNLGLICGVIAAIGQGLGAVVSRKAYSAVELAGLHVDGLTAAYQRILGGLIVGALPAAWLLGRQVIETRGRTTSYLPGSTPAAKLPWRKATPWVLLNALAGPALGVGCYQWALATTPSGIVLPIVATLPIAVIPLAYLFEGDRPSWRSVLGGVVAVAGVIALTMVRR